MRDPRCVIRLVGVCLIACLAGCGTSTAVAGVIHLRSCSAYGDNATGAWLASSKGSKMSAGNACAEGGSLQLIAEGASLRKDYVEWRTTVPSQMNLITVAIPSSSVLINPKAAKAGYSARYAWPGGTKAVKDTGNACCGGMDFGSGINTTFAGTRWLELAITCNLAQCTGVPGQVLDVKGIELTATDTTAPKITPEETTTNIANEAGRWIRGTWDASFVADSQAGVCQTWVAVNGTKLVEGPYYTPATGSWTQCGSGAGTLKGSGANSVSATIDTSRYANGPLSVQYYASDPAQPANVASPSYQVAVDNTPVALSLDGPTQALTTEGPQAVSAIAAAGPSGVSGILCSVDGSPLEWHGGASEAIQVSNPGINTVVCAARNNAINGSGQPAQSAVQRWTVDIRKPSVSLVSLAHVANALRCTRTWTRLHVPARWVTEHYRGHKIRVRIPPQTRRVAAEHCHPHVRVVRVRHGSRVFRERIVELPRRVSGSHLRVAFGHGAFVSGWLGTPGGNALPGQVVDVETAPADGRGDYTVARRTR